jgi:exo-beta-1,3-glucanase (GH17 family)/cellulose synthase/poly-beta-1,6-N-acetylglucosamine synthase-like glycosyltransferase
LPGAPRALAAVFTALSVAILLAALNLGAWSWLNRPLDLPGWEGGVGGVAFSGYQRDQDPIAQRYPTVEELDADLHRVADLTGRIRVYTAVDNPDVPALAAGHGLRVAVGAWLDGRTDNNDIELGAAVRAARENRNVHRLMVGNEAVLRGDLTPQELIVYLKRAKRFTRVPVSTAEPWHVWLRYPELGRHVDFITVHLLPYWEGVPADKAVDYALERYDEVARRFPKKPIVIGEIGWPSRGDRVGGAIASPAEQARFLRDFFDRTRERRLDYYLMEMFDQPWKQAHEGRAGAYWGLFHADRTQKFPLAGPVDADPRWRAKAVASALLAAPFVLWFALAFRRLRLPGLIAFGALIQATVAALVWLATIPFEFYLRPVDWVAYAVLLPGAAAMLAVLLANGFEFVEVLWRRRWRREFRPVPLPPGAPEPFVSVHLAACNEPPEMVILTLDSLARLDYANFEVVVVDNNTRDERLWKPVEAHCAKLGPKFRFFHLPQWPGFKAGALNFALRETDPRAAIVGVVDADYAVEAQWLRRLVAHFAEEDVAVVQAPQAHRDFAASAFRRMANWEFDGFFRVGMHHRNERNAIIQHGTMSLVRRRALEGAGGWAEWCICEDAELGLRLMERGHELRYVDEVLGRGLTPSDFGAFKTQRFRWAFGAMQILKGHWRALTRRGGPARLTAGQRYHFLTGWFSWFADALHLLFAFGAIAWTIGAVAAPQYFPLPLDLYLVPVLAFLAAKAVFGPALYRARVDCSWTDLIGASAASMALSHAIARGVFEGLWRRTGEFKRTAKGAGSAPRFAWLAAIREETLMLIALALAAAAVVWRFGADHPEAMLWAIVLAAQALPYAATLAVARVSAGASTVPARAPAAPEPVPAPRTLSLPGAVPATVPAFKAAA